MIRTESEYRRARVDVETGRADIASYINQLAAEGLAPEQIERLIAPSHSSNRQLEREVVLYEKFRSGDLGDFQRLEDLERLLVAARIADNCSQRALAGRLAVNETQVSRDERGGYQGITLKRVRDILGALGVTVRIAISTRASKPLGSSLIHFERRPTTAKQPKRQFRIVDCNIFEPSAERVMSSGAA